VNLHVLFAALLWICVAAQFYVRVRRAPFMLPADLRLLVRSLSRFVYLALYLLMFFRIAIGATHPAEDFQGYLAGGLVALVTIRVLAALYRHFARPGTHAAVPCGSAKRAANVA
jgi:hypothetical protein